MLCPWIAACGCCSGMSVCVCVCARCCGQFPEAAPPEPCLWLHLPLSPICPLPVCVLAGAAILVGLHPLVSFFTSDAAVQAVAATALPLVAVFLPLDAAASIMDGGLLAASQTDLLSAIQVSTPEPSTPAQRACWPAGGQEQWRGPGAQERVRCAPGPHFATSTAPGAGRCPTLLATQAGRGP